MKDIMELIKNWRMLLLLGLLLISAVFINPHYIVSPDGKISLATNIEKGLDMKGGVRAILSPENATPEIIDEIISKLNVRINAIGLTETKIFPVSNKYIQVEMAGKTEDEIKAILEQQGKFEAKINRYVTIKNGTGTLSFGKVYSISTLDTNDIEINGTVLKINDTITLEDVKYTYINNTENTVILAALAYTGDDVEKVFKDAQHARVEPASNAYRFTFDIILSKNAAERFAKITKNIPIELGSQYLSSSIDLYIDDELVDTLRISEGLKGSVQTTISISGPGETRQDAVNKMKMFQSILESGALPTKLTIEKIDTISPTLGERFMETAILSIILAVVAISLLIFIRYKDIRIAVPIMITSLSEVVIILGFAAWIHWTIDLASIAGIIAAVGTGLDAQIIITDEGGKRREIENMKTKLKNAFVIIFTSAATTIAAMVPLMFVGAGAVKGFAVTTIIGVLIGVLITRPAYGKMLEFLKS